MRKCMMLFAHKNLYRGRAPLWKRSLHCLCWIRSGASAIRPLTNHRQPQTCLGSGHPLIQVSCPGKAQLLICKLCKLLSLLYKADCYREATWGLQEAIQLGKQETPSEACHQMTAACSETPVRGAVCLISMQRHGLCVSPLQALLVRKGMNI